MAYIKEIKFQIPCLPSWTELRNVRSGIGIILNEKNCQFNPRIVVFQIRKQTHSHMNNLEYQFDMLSATIEEEMWILWIV